MNSIKAMNESALRRLFLGHALKDCDLNYIVSLIQSVEKCDYPLYRFLMMMNMEGIFISAITYRDEVDRLIRERNTIEIIRLIHYNVRDVISISEDNRRYIEDTIIVEYTSIIAFLNDKKNRDYHYIYKLFSRNNIVYHPPYKNQVTIIEEDNDKKTPVTYHLLDLLERSYGGNETLVFLLNLVK